MMWSGIFASLLFVGAESGSSRLDVIQLPLGFSPEGITLGRKWTAFVGSRAHGSIWKGDLSTGEGEVVVSEVGNRALGLDHDRRSGYLFACFASAARVYDDNFSLVAEFVFAGEGEVSTINDVYVTKTAAYFTDSSRDKIYKVPLDADSGEILDLAVTDANTITLSEDFGFVEGEINGNGIVANDDGSVLIVVNSHAGQIFTVDPETGAAALIDLGGVLVHADGLILRKNTLWAVDNGRRSVSGLQQISEISLSADLTCGSVVPRGLTSALFDLPTTAVRKGNSLYAVSGKFDVAAEDVPATEYEIVRVDRDSGDYMCTSS